jgi:hypothetical protein
MLSIENRGKSRDQYDSHKCLFFLPAILVNGHQYYRPLPFVTSLVRATDMKHVPEPVEKSVESQEWRAAGRTLDIPLNVLFLDAPPLGPKNTLPFDRWRGAL